ncbi:MAG: hypothetical protein R3B45_09560 [Bdellovibrionota bacterium]
MKNLIALILTLFTGDAFASSISLNEILENQDTIVVEPILYKGLPIQESNRFGVGGSAEQICKAAGYTTVREKSKRIKARRERRIYRADF